MTDTDPKAVVIRYVQAARDGMAAVIRDSFTPDATWQYPGDLPLSGTHRGIDAIVNQFLGGAAALMAPGTKVVLELTNVVAEGEQVVAEWTARATARNGRAYHNRNVGIFTVRDGRIVSVREYTDTQHAAQVLFPADQRAGVRPATPR
jgi:ketosteroid isomerase-like protein